MIPQELATKLEEKAKYIAACPDWSNSNSVLLGLPMDYTTSFRPGARFAPYRIREVSEAIEEYSIYQKKSLANLNYYDAGDVILPFGNTAESLNNIESVAKSIITANKKIFAIGGEHLVSLPIIKAYHSKFKDLVVIQMDAHADLRKDYLGQKLSHACVMRRAIEHIGQRRLIQLGIRSGTEDEIAYANEHSYLFLDEFEERIDETVNLVGQRPVYISLDIDVLDPAFAPGTGTPEAGGITSKQLFTALHKFSELNVVGFDLVEICPAYDQHDITSILGAKILREALLAFS